MRRIIFFSVLSMAWHYHLSAQCIPVITNDGPHCEGRDLQLTASDLQVAESGISMNGGGDYLAIQNISYSSAALTEMTIEAWIRTSSGSDQIIASFDRSEYWRLEINGDGAGTGQVGFDILTSAGQLDLGGSSRVDDGNWHHVAAVFDNGNVYIYVDGQLDASASSGTTFGTGVTRFGFLGTGSEAATFNGARAPNNYFIGQLDEVRLWSVALSQSEINEWMNKEVQNGNCIHPRFAGLQAYWQLNEGTGTTSADEEASAHLTFGGTPSWVASSAAPVYVCYNWTGPAGFNSTEQNPSLSNVTTSNSGIYSVTASSRSCTSPAQNTVVAIVAAPAAPAAVSPAAYCDGDPVADLVATANTSGNPANINWYTDAGLTTLAGSGSPFTPAPVAGTTVTYYVTETDGVCDGPATPVHLTVNALPSKPLATTSAPVCEGDTLQLSGSGIDQEAGYALLLGNTDYVAIQNQSYASNALPEVTVETWIRTSNGNNQVIASFDRSEYWRLEINGNGGGTGQIGWDISTNSGILDLGGTARVDDGNWHHVAAVYDHGLASIYIDGVLDNTASMGTAYGTGATRFGFLGVGSEASSFNGFTGPNDYFNGEMDEFRIWNVALSPGVINDWKDQAVNASHPHFSSLETYYPFDDGSGSVATDAANNNDGTFAGSPSWVSNSGPGINLPASWQGPNSFASGNLNAFIMPVSAANAGDYVLTVTDAAGCQNKDTVAVVVNTATASPLAASPAPYCEGDAIAALTATTDPPGNEASLRWFSDETQQVLVGSGGSYVPATSVGATISYYVAETNGLCLSIAPTEVMVTVNPLPEIPVLSSNSPVCNGDTLELQAALGSQAGNGLSMNGSDYLAISNFNYNGSAYTEMTVEAWIRTSDGSDQILLSFDRSEYWRFEINGTGGGTGQVSLGIRTNAGILNVAGSTRVDDGSWHHVAAVYDNGVARLYVDGILENSASRGTSFGKGTTRYGFVGIGSEADVFNGATGPATPYNGELDEVRIWNAALSAATISEWKNKPVDATHPDFADLAIYYPFDEGSGNVTADAKNDNDAIFVNTPSWTVPSAAPLYDIPVWSGPAGFSSTAADTFLLNAAAVNAGTYTLAVTTGAGCSLSEDIEVVINEITAFQSSRSGNWSDPSTWSCDIVPDATVDIEISGGHVVTVDMAAACKDLTVTGKLDFNSATSIAIHGDLSVNGTLDGDSGLVTMQGSSLQQMQSIDTVTFAGLTINNAAGVNMVSGAYEISGTLTLQEGLLTTANALTLLSAPDGTANIAEITGGSIGGDVTVQRYIDAGATNWRFLCSPVSGQTLADWDDDLITSGFTGSDFPSFPFVNIYTYNESTTGPLGNGYVAAGNISNPLGVGQGFWVWSGDTITGTDPFTIDVSGPANTGNISLPVTYTDDPGQPATEDGWNLVGNPYPSTIDWDDPEWTKTNVNNAIYIWDPDQEQFAAYIGGVGTNGGSRFIASSQAFWVQANAPAPALTAREGVKSNNDQVFLRSKSVARKLSLEVKGNGYADETVLVLNEQASAAFDAGYDARKVYSSKAAVPSLSSKTGNENYAINSIPFITADLHIPLEIKTGLAGNFILQIDNDWLKEDYGCLYLEDLKTGQYLDLESSASYSFYLSDTTKAPRFLLHIGTPLHPLSTDADCYGAENGMVEVTSPNIGSWTLQLTTNTGSVHTMVSSSATAKLDGLPAGTHELLAAPYGQCDTLIRALTIQTPAPVVAAFTPSASEVVVKKEVSFSNLSLNTTQYRWEFGDGQISNLEAPVHAYALPGIYTVVLEAGISDSCIAMDQQQIKVTAEATTSTDIGNSRDILLVYAYQQQIHISFNSGTSRELQLEVFNVQGKKLHEEAMGTQRELERDIPFRQAEGIYFVHVIRDGKKAVFKIALLR